MLVNPYIFGTLDPNVTLLMNAVGTNGLTSIQDDRYGMLFTPLGGAVVSTADSPFTGGSSIAFTGSSALCSGLSANATIGSMTTWSIEAWFKPTSMASDQCILAATRDTSNLYSISALSTGAVSFSSTVAGSTSTYTSSSTPFAANAWYYVLVTYDGTTLSIYVNGVQHLSTAASGFPTGLLRVELGASYLTSSQWLTGYIGPVRITKNRVRDGASVPGAVFGSGYRVFPYTYSGWYPTALFTSGEVGGIWDISDLSTLFNDTSGTIPAALNGAVALIRDKSGNGWDLVLDTATAYLRKDTSGYYYLDFTSNPSFLLTVTPSSTYGASGAGSGMAIQVPTVDTGDIQMVMSFSDTSHWYNVPSIILQDRTMLGGAVDSSNASVYSSGYGGNQKAGSVVSYVNNITTSYTWSYVNGATASATANTSGTFSLSSSSQFRLGGTYGWLHRYNGRFYGGFWVNRPLTPDEVMSADKWLQHLFSASYPVMTWQPTALFASGEDGFIYDPSRMYTLYRDQSATPTIPVTAVGQEVATVLDVGYRSYTLTRVAGALSQPLYQNDGKPYLDFTSSASCGFQCPNVTGTNWAGSNGYTIGAAVTPYTVDVSTSPYYELKMLASVVDSSTQYAQLLRIAGNSAVATIPQTVSFNTSVAAFGDDGPAVAVSTSTAYTLSGRCSSTAIETRTNNVSNGSTPYSGDWRVKTNDPYSLFTFNGASQYYGRFYGFVYIKRPLEEGELSNLNNWMHRLYI